MKECESQKQQQAFYRALYSVIKNEERSMYHVSQDTSEQRLVPKASPLLF